MSSSGSMKLLRYTISCIFLAKLQGHSMPTGTQFNEVGHVPSQLLEKFGHNVNLREVVNSENFSSLPYLNAGILLCELSRRQQDWQVISVKRNFL